MIRAAIFDMDGLLVDSEPLWQDAEVEVFGALGVPLTHEMCRQTTGLRMDDVIRHWHERFPWGELREAQVARDLTDAVIGRIRAGAEEKPGATDAVAFVRGLGLRVGLASSSPLPIIHAVLERLGLRFSVVRSGETEPLSKPHPGIFLRAALELDVPARACVVFEDSLAGVIAAKAARMTCVCVPEAWPRHDPRLGLADAIVRSLRDVDADLLARLGLR